MLSGGFNRIVVNYFFLGINACFTAQFITYNQLFKCMVSAINNIVHKAAKGMD